MLSSLLYRNVVPNVPSWKNGNGNPIYQEKDGVCKLSYRASLVMSMTFGGKITWQLEDPSKTVGLPTSYTFPDTAGATLRYEFPYDYHAFTEFAYPGFPYFVTSYTGKTPFWYKTGQTDGWTRATYGANHTYQDENGYNRTALLGYNGREITIGFTWDENRGYSMWRLFIRCSPDGGPDDNPDLRSTGFYVCRQLTSGTATTTGTVFAQFWPTADRIGNYWMIFEREDEWPTDDFRLGLHTPRRFWYIGGTDEDSNMSLDDLYIDVQGAYA